MIQVINNNSQSPMSAKNFGGQVISKLFTQFKKRKFTSVVILLLIVYGAYWGYGRIFSSAPATSYITAQAQKGTLIVSISGSGQVATSNQMDIKPKISGDITNVYAVQGQEIESGTVIAQIDTLDAQRALRDAGTSLETAKLELDKMLQPPDAYTITQAENSLIQARDSLTKLKFTQENKYNDALKAIDKADDNINKAYEDGFNTVTSTFLSLPNVMTGLENLLFGNTLDESQDNITWYVNQTNYLNNERDKAVIYRDDAIDAYNKARSAYAVNFDDYKTTSRFSVHATIENLIEQTYETTQLIAEASRISNNLIGFVRDAMEKRKSPIPSGVAVHQSALSSYTNTTNNQLSSLLSIKSSIQDNNEAKTAAQLSLTEMNQNNPLDLAAAERSVKDKEDSLVKLKEAPDELDIRAKKITIQQREDAYTVAKQTLADRSVRAPFSGVIAKINAKKGDSATTGTIIATLITKQRILEISLNEIDVSKVKTGQKATITFDAVEDLSITGEVAEIDSVGTVSQGVVTYVVKIVFDTQDDRVKPSMSASVAIITDVRQNILLVPNSAVKTQNNTSYVEILSAGAQAAKQQTVEVGISNDTMSEIISGLNENDSVVTQTITGVATQAQTQSTGFRLPGIGGGGRGGR